MKIRGETTNCGAEGASNKDCESLRQKDPYWTLLWREFYIVEPPKGKVETTKLSGERTEVFHLYNWDISVFFYYYVADRLKEGNLVTSLKRTPIYPLYKNYGGKTINFGGWEMPVQFSSIKEEHRAVRENAGLFDVSHMGEILVKGKNSFHFLQTLITNDLSKLKPGGTQYTAICYENGGVVDDLLIYQLDSDEYLLVVNAANTDKDFEWLQKNRIDDVQIENVSDQYALLALQGPKSQEILQLLVDLDLNEIKPFRFQNNLKVAGVNSLVSRTGYTGEDGFEIYCPPEEAPYLWEKLLEVGTSYGLLPCGLGARDTLRFEAGLPLYGQELSEKISPLEAGISFVVKLNKEEDFIGKNALKEQKEKGVERKLVGIEMIDRGIPRQGYKVFFDNNEIGIITSGTQSPTLNKNLGLALLQSEYGELDTQVEVSIRGKMLKAKIVPIPFYSRKK